MSAKIREYPPEVRAAAIDVVRKLGSCRKAAKRLGIHYQTLHRWVREVKPVEEEPPRWRCSCGRLRPADEGCCGSPPPPRKD